MSILRKPCGKDDESMFDFLLLSDASTRTSVFMLVYVKVNEYLCVWECLTVSM